MKKLAAFLGAFIFALSAVSCEKNDPNRIGDIAPENIKTAEKLGSTVYKKETLSLPSDMKNGYFMSPYDGSSKYIVLGSVDLEPAFWTADSKLSDFNKEDFSDFDYGINYAIAVADDGTVVTFVNHVDYGELSEPDDDLAEYCFIINSYSPDGKLLSSVPVDSEYNRSAGKMPLIGSMCTDGKFIVIELEGTYELFDIEGKYYGNMCSEDVTVTGIGRNSSGQIVCAVSTDNEQIMLCTLDEKGKLTSSDTAYQLGETIQGAMTPGTDDYSLFIKTSSAIYGINSADNAIEMLFDFHGAGVSARNVNGFRRDDDGNFILLICDYQNPTSLTKFIPQTAEEIENTPVLTIGYCSGEGQDSYFISDHITPWNADNSHDFRVELKFYQMDYEKNEVFDEIAKDTLAGELPDVFFLSSNGYFGNVNMLEKDAVCDLYEFMDKDELYNRDYFIPNLLKCFEHDGKLPALSDRFDIELGYCAKKKFIGEGSDMTIDKMVELTINPPIKVEPDPTDSKIGRANGAFLTNLMWTDWTDLNSGTCDYDSDSFIRFLKYCNEAPVVEFDYSNYDSTPEGMTEQEQFEWWREEERKSERGFLDDTRLFAWQSIGSYENYVELVRGKFGGEELSFIDEPKITFGDPMAINASSKNKEMAWDFIKSYFSIERYRSANKKDANGYIQTGLFPITKDGLKYDEEFSRSDYMDFHNMEETKDDPEWKDYVGYVYMIDFQDFSYNIKLGQLTDEDVAAVNNIIDNAVPSTYIDLTDEKYYEIAREELLRFFNGGCTAEQCANAMQSRLSIYLSERYSN